MGGHYHETFSLAGKVSYPVMVDNCGKRGKELTTAYEMIDEGRALLGRYFPDLILADSLYFNSNFFDKVREGDSYVLIKSADSDFPILSDRVFSDNLFFSFHVFGRSTVPSPAKGFIFVPPAVKKGLFSLPSI